jgi:hypothetical protein
MSPVDRREAAAHIISRLDDRFRFEDHRRIEQGDVRAVAEQLKKQARYQQWTGGLLSVVFATWAALNLIDYGAGSERLDLMLAILMLAFTVGNAAFTAHQSAHITSTADQAIRLLDGEREPA